MPCASSSRGEKPSGLRAGGWSGLVWGGGGGEGCGGCKPGMLEREKRDPKHQVVRHTSG